MLCIWWRAVRGQMAIFLWPEIWRRSSFHSLSLCTGVHSVSENCLKILKATTKNAQLQKQFINHKRKSECEKWNLISKIEFKKNNEKFKGNSNHPTTIFFFLCKCNFVMMVMMKNMCVWMWSSKNGKIKQQKKIKWREWCKYYKSRYEDLRVPFRILMKI